MMDGDAKVIQSDDGGDRTVRGQLCWCDFDDKKLRIVFLKFYWLTFNLFEA